MHTPRDRLPVRHFSGIYFSDGALRPNGTESAAMERTFALAVPELREAWRAYWTCKLDRVCQQHALCAARQIDNEDWISASSLSRGLAADDSLAQWRPPPESFGWQNGSAWRALANLHVNDGGAARAGFSRGRFGRVSRLSDPLDVALGVYRSESVPEMVSVRRPSGGSDWLRGSRDVRMIRPVSSRQVGRDCKSGFRGLGKLKKGLGKSTRRASQWASD